MQNIRPTGQVMAKWAPRLTASLNRPPAAQTITASARSNAGLGVVGRSNLNPVNNIGGSPLLYPPVAAKSGAFWVENDIIWSLSTTVAPYIVGFSNYQTVKLYITTEFSASPLPQADYANLPFTPEDMPITGVGFKHECVYMLCCRGVLGTFAKPSLVSILQTGGLSAPLTNTLTAGLAPLIAGNGGAINATSPTGSKTISNYYTAMGSLAQRNNSLLLYLST